MPNEQHSGSREYEAEDAALGHAGLPASLPHRERAGAELPETATPSQEELDERERKFARRRKPMGPTSGQIPETVPEETPEETSGGTTSDQQADTTPESRS